MRFILARLPFLTNHIIMNGFIIPVIITLYDDVAGFYGSNEKHKKISAGNVLAQLEALG